MHSSTRQNSLSAGVAGKKQDMGQSQIVYYYYCEEPSCSDELEPRGARSWTNHHQWPTNDREYETFTFFVRWAKPHKADTCTLEYLS